MKLRRESDLVPENPNFAGPGGEPCVSPSREYHSNPRQEDLKITGPVVQWIE